MKYLVGFTIGVLLAIPIMSIYGYFNPSARDLSILIDIVNDTNMTVENVTLEANSTGQKFSCTLKYNKCSLAVLSTGDTTFKVYAIMTSGEVLTGSIGYSDPRSNRAISISQLSIETT